MRWRFREVSEACSWAAVVMTGDAGVWPAHPRSSGADVPHLGIFGALDPISGDLSWRNGLLLVEGEV